MMQERKIGRGQPAGAKRVGEAAKKRLMTKFFGILCAAPAAFPVLIAALVATTFTPVADAAIINATAYASGAGSFTDDASILDAAIENDGTFQTSDATVTVDDILEPSGFFSGAIAIREEGETEDIRLSNLILQFFSDDTNRSFNGNNVLFADVDYNGTTARGFLAGPDGELFTSDDVEVFGDGSQNVDLIGVIGYGVNFDDTVANRTYFESEVDFTVATQYDLVDDGFTGIGRDTFASTVTAVPEPTSFMLIASSASLVMVRRRRRCV